MLEYPKNYEASIKTDSEFGKRATLLEMPKEPLFFSTFRVLKKASARVGKIIFKIQSIEKWFQRRS